MNNNIMSLLPLIMGMSGGSGGLNLETLSALLSNVNNSNASKNTGGFNPLTLMLMAKMFNNKPQQANNNESEQLNNLDSVSKLFGSDVANALSLFLKMKNKD